LGGGGDNWLEGIGGATLGISRRERVCSEKNGKDRECEEVQCVKDGGKRTQKLPRNNPSVRSSGFLALDPVYFAVGSIEKPPVRVSLNISRLFTLSCTNSQLVQGKLASVGLGLSFVR